MVIKVHLLRILQDEVIDVDEDITILNFSYIKKIGVRKDFTYIDSCKNKIKTLALFPPNKAKTNPEKILYIEMGSGEVLYALENISKLDSQLV